MVDLCKVPKNYAKPHPHSYEWRRLYRSDMLIVTRQYNKLLLNGV